MKKKIKQLSEGNFEYELPKIILSEEKIEFSVETGMFYEGIISIKNNKGSFMKGMVYSENKFFKIQDPAFMGEYSEIKYKFDALNLSSGEVIKGKIDIVSSCGEISVPYEVIVEAPFCMTSMGKIRNLFHFTNLAKDNPAEAVHIFKSKEFKRVFLYNEPQYNILYKGLIRSISPSQAMEEFLIAVHKKLAINIKADKTFSEYEVTDEPFKEKLVLTKDQWGYFDIKVSADVDFILPEHKIIWSDYFIGNQYALEFIIDPRKMRYGKNFGRLYLKTARDTIIFQVMCHRGNPDKKGELIYKKKKVVSIVNDYLDFRMNKLTIEQYRADIIETVADLISTDNVMNSETVFYDLLKTHILIISNKRERAKQMLDKFMENIDDIKRGSIENYCSCLYLNALYSKDNTKIKDSVKIIEDYYENGYDTFKLLWILLYLDKKFDKDKALKHKKLKEQYNKGNKSPVLYFEECSLFNNEPGLLAALDEFEIRSMYWGIKNNFIKKETAVQYVYLASKEKKFTQLVFKALELLYKKYETKEILSAICRILIKGNKTSHEYFYWYQLGVNYQLKITQIHEYYIESIDESKTTIIEQSALMYFAYNSSISENKRAFLYAYIIKNKDNMNSVYRSYLKQIMSFALKQMEHHNISDNLSVIYQDCITNEFISKDNINDFTKIIFKHIIKCSNKNIKGVVVIHKEIKQEVYVPLISGEAYINIFTDNARIFLVDQNDRRYESTIDYTINEMLSYEEYTEFCYYKGSDNYMLILNLLEKIELYQKFDDMSLEIRYKALKINELRNDYKKKILQTFLNYYYDNFDAELMEEYLKRIDVHSVSSKERGRIIELLIIRDMLDEAIEAVKVYGCFGVSSKKLLKLCSKKLMTVDMESCDTELLNLCYCVFEAKKYDERILLYLIKFYNGTTEAMYEIWKTSREFDMKAVELEERLLGQILFSESYVTNSLAVFRSYYNEGCNKVLIRAFLSYYSYKFLVRGRVLQNELFNIIRRELYYEENEICMIALLKYYSYQYELNEDEIKYIDINVNKIIDKGIVLPFFKEFKERIKLPESVCNKYYVEYKANPASKIIIHYRIEGSGEKKDFVSEIMKNVYMGIHTKEFILFYNEELQYYITEEDGNGEKITESFNLKMDSSLGEVEETRYSQINFMLMAKEMQDETTLVSLMENYVKTEYLASELFKLL